MTAGLIRTYGITVVGILQLQLYLYIAAKMGIDTPDEQSPITSNGNGAPTKTLGATLIPVTAVRESGRCYVNKRVNMAAFRLCCHYCGAGHGFGSVRKAISQSQQVRE
jgi:hypothetical protein